MEVLFLLEEKEMLSKVLIGLLIGLFLLFIYSCCRVASESDKNMEDIENEKNV